MRRAGLIAVALLAVAVAACGRKGALRPIPGQRPEPISHGRTAAPTIDEALQPLPDEGPERVDDVIRRPEQPRPVDPFDPPPPRARR